MKKYLLILSLTSFMVMPAFGSTIMDDISDVIHEKQLEVDQICHGRYEGHMANLAELVANYIDGRYIENDLRLEMGLLNAEVIASDVFCLFSDQRNLELARHKRMKQNYKDARVDIKHGLKMGKRKSYFVGIFAKYGFKSFFDYFIP